MESLDHLKKARRRSPEGRDWIGKCLEGRLAEDFGGCRQFQNVSVLKNMRAAQK